MPKRKVGKVPKSSPVAMRNAEQWNKAGYKDWVKGDAAREKAQPVGEFYKRSSKR